MIGAILAIDDCNGIGFENGLPWPHNRADMEHFKRVTEGHVVIMGRKTWESIGSKPLPNRECVVLSSLYSGKIEESGILKISGDIDLILECIEDRWPDKAVWIIGGKSVYEAAKDYIDVLVVSRIKGSHKCDTHINSSFFEGFHCMSKDVIDETLTIVRMEKGYAR